MVVLNTVLSAAALARDIDLTVIVINGKKLLSLQPVVRTRGYNKRVGLIKRQKSFQGLAI